MTIASRVTAPCHVLGWALLGSLALASPTAAQESAEVRFQPDVDEWSLYVSPQARRDETERFVPLCQGACQVSMPTGTYVFQLRDASGVLFTDTEWLYPGPYYALARLQAQGVGAPGVFSMILMIAGVVGGLTPLLLIGDGLEPGIAAAVSIPIFGLGILGVGLTILTFGDWQPREPILYVGRDED